MITSKISLRACLVAVALLAIAASLGYYACFLKNSVAEVKVSRALYLILIDSNECHVARQLALARYYYYLTKINRSWYGGEFHDYGPVDELSIKGMPIAKGPFSSNEAYNSLFKNH